MCHKTTQIVKATHPCAPLPQIAIAYLINKEHKMTQGLYYLASPYQGTEQQQATQTTLT